MKRKVIADPILMLLSILVIIGFQVYWLKDNYEREKKTLQIKTNVTFQETVHQLQSKKLRIPYNFLNDSSHKRKTRIFYDEDVTDTAKDENPGIRHKIITMVNTLRDKLNDSTQTDSTEKTTMIVTMGAKPRLIESDNLPAEFRRFSDTGNHIINVLYKVDSLQDSIKVEELSALYSTNLKKQHISVPFLITKRTGVKEDAQDDMSKVVVGFAHPVTYQVMLPRTKNYLLQKIRLPILFSVFLVGVTLLSFVLLYRNILRQQRLAEIKNDFISNITHELKTPIATVGVAIEALRNFNALHDPQKTKEYLDISSGELQRLSLLVDKVLKLSMFEKREIELNKEPFDLEKLIREVLDIMRLQFEKHNAAVNFDTVGENFIVKADKLHITSVMYNLLDNALKYSRESPAINIRLLQEKNILTIKVIDNGIGIQKEYTRKIFDKFFRVPTGNNHSVKGYGLGLSYVSEIIKRHMGYIVVESEYGNGSTFIIKVPSEEADTIRFDDKRVLRKILPGLRTIKKI